jgi:hypothetical protein
MFNLFCSAELGCSYILVLIKKENVISRVLSTLSLHRSTELGRCEILTEQHGKGTK